MCKLYIKVIIDTFWSKFSLIVLILPVIMDENLDTIQRRPRKRGVIRSLKKIGRVCMRWSIPFARYAIMPGMFYIATYHTNPKPDFWDLVNPFF